MCQPNCNICLSEFKSFSVSATRGVHINLAHYILNQPAATDYFSFIYSLQNWIDFDFLHPHTSSYGTLAHKVANALCAATILASPQSKMIFFQVQFFPSQPFIEMLTMTNRPSTFCQSHRHLLNSTF